MSESSVRRLRGRSMNGCRGEIKKMCCFRAAHSFFGHNVRK
nr:MAG TPA: hypothetical protein [Caudoviricetes sp.]